MENSDTTVIYNGTCPICAREIGAYRRSAEARALPIRFHDLAGGGLDGLGLSQDDAARRLHVLKDGTLHAGLDAFVILWRGLPGLRWLARFVTLPVIRPAADALYERVLAPLLYGMHRRRLARRGRNI